MNQKLGVRGLVDAGLKKILRIFIKIKLEDRSSNGDSKLSIPVINLQGMNENESLRNKVEKKVGKAEALGLNPNHLRQSDVQRDFFLWVIATQIDPNSN
ncbi:hypothetical protein FEM48_Zijuj07G0104400 [Ziziphus jujuba var. spinosa]|uniref:Uncharacterized protein n=1 Tax=Ziziphus jujuba var. spinosa TaxID=714518 RepID=A0A978V438_ZIZJJ|nr:hypothetical protein FEM48_Zijuj07G0104400 [Ziziphus jujuba var. spinosa]